MEAMQISRRILDVISRHWIKKLLLIAVVATMASCTSHRHVARGDAQQRLEAAINAAIEAEHSHPKVHDAARVLLAEADTWKGTPYKYGGHSKLGTDCSGFVMEVFDTALSIKLPRSTREMSDHCKEIQRKELRPGDIVFFQGTKKGNVNHVGLYVGDGRMIHASSSKGVRYDDIDSDYYRAHYHHCGRVPQLAQLIEK